MEPTTTPGTARTSEGTAASSLDYFKRVGSPIVAPATASGGPVAIIRVSGQDLSFLKGLMGSLPDPGSFAVRKIRSNNGERINMVDSSLVLFFQAPHSFTGEDVVEIHCHGVPAIVERICELVRSSGSRMALPGEFSFRAVMNGKMNLEEAEALQCALSSEGLDVSVASQLLSGSLRAKKSLDSHMNEVVLQVQIARGRVEAAIDFPEAEAEQSTDLRDGLARIEEVRRGLAKLLSAHENFCLHLGEPRISIIGNTNVGKSTLFNLLCGGSKAIVSRIPGTTRDVLEGKVRLPSGRWVRLLDTAGLRTLNEADLSDHENLELIGMRLGLGASQQSRITVLVERTSERNNSSLRTKMIHLSSENSLAFFSHADEDNAEFEGAFDLIKNSERARCWLLDQIDGLLSSQENKKLPTDEEQSLIVSERQRQVVVAALDEIERSREAILGQRPIELAAIHLSSAESLLKKAVGRESGDEYIGQIFSQFCLGK